MVAHKKGKKKVRRQQGSAAGQGMHETSIHAEIIDEESEYPTSRVIKRAPNGDVIVESLPDEESVDAIDMHQKNRAGSSSSSSGSNSGFTGAAGAASAVDDNDTVDNHGQLGEDLEDTKWPIKLDTHWESLSLEDRRNILRISKDELFQMIKSYKNMHNCDCSMCGRHNNLNIEQEIEQIYCELYDSAREEDAATDFVQFHLKLIKEYQNGTYSNHHHTRHHGDTMSSNGLPGNSVQNDNNPNDSTNKNDFIPGILPRDISAENTENKCKNDFYNSLSDDPAIKYCLSEGAIEPEKSYQVDFLGREEVDENTGSVTPIGHKAPSALNWKHEIEQFKNSKQRQLSESATGSVNPSQLNEPDDINEAVPEYDEVDSKLLRFAKTLVSSHPHIAEEFINRAMMYPHIKAITEDMMNNEGEGLKRAMESLVLQQQNQEENENRNSPIEKKIYEVENDHPSNNPTAANTSENGDADRLKDIPQEEQGAVSGLETLDKNSSLENAQLDSLIDSMAFEFVKDPTAITSLKNAFYDIFTNKSKRSEIDQDDKEYNEELERLRNEISADEDQESYEWSNDEYEESNYHNVGTEECIDDECIDDHHLESDYNEDNEDEDAIYDDLHENAKIEGDHSTIAQRQSKLAQHENSAVSNASEDDIDDDYDSELDHAERLEEGRRLIQIAITKLLQKKLIASYQEKEAEKNRERLLMELEAEENQKKEKEKKKLKKKEKEKEKKRQQQLAKEEEKKRQEEEAIRLKKEAEEKEIARRETQRQKVEEAKRKNDEKRKKKLAEQRRREEEQERIRKEKEEQKRLREEEQKQKKKEKERKQRELDEQRLLKKKESEELHKQKESLKRQAQSVPQNKETTIEGVPYGAASNNSMQHNSSLNDDIFNMINEVSKSLSSSPSHHQNDLLGSSVLPNVHNQNNLSSNNVFVSPTSLSMSDMSPQSQPAFAPLVSSLQPNAFGGWDQPPSAQPYYGSNQHASIEAPGLLPLSQTGPSKFSSFANTTVDPSDDVNSLTNFLKDTTLNDLSVRTNSNGPVQSMDPVSAAACPQPVAYNQPSLWSNDPSQRLSNFGQQHVQQNQLPPQSQPRRSIWDTGAETAFGNNPANNFAPNIWDTPTSTPSAPSTLLSAQLPEVSVESYEDVLVKSYKLLSPDNSFVPLDKLYQASLTQINAKSVFSYPQFVSTLVAMKNTYNTELLNDNTGLLAYCRMGSIPVSAGLPSYGQNSYPPHPATQVNLDSQPMNPILDPVSNHLTQSSASVFNDIQYNQAPTGTPIQGNPTQNSAPATASDTSSFMNFAQSFPNSYQSSNIWG
ncbi:unnamed protein product [Kluyveromyces dobzhanskii CBS 2104]|uniref:Stress response protein NST1 n=1 Tax=Kluyveromyces dobzhanskii CBS 2104 TaxID=1427455 RepID=A0A0A8LB91_9SACH|nr:unnamed protein product [Kluyveromyces dobzhanskii CBS 2104]